MKATNACLPCMISQAYNTAILCTTRSRLAEAHPRRGAASAMLGIELDDTPAVLSQIAYELCRELSGCEDPYLPAKRESNEAALKLYPELRERLEPVRRPAARRPAAGGRRQHHRPGHRAGVRPGRGHRQAARARL